MTVAISDLLEPGVVGNKDNIIVDNNICPGSRVNFEREKYLISRSSKNIYACKSHWISDNQVGIKVSPTLRSNNPYTSVYSDFRIRRLTPKEAFKFMGLNDGDISKIIKSNIPVTQLYKLAGNSIVVPVLENIFKNLLQDYIT